uniref:Transmembrane protein n=1 Tax=Salix viminalis TaxID=40686 RepID=A0A6N2N1U5_SALVM
MNCNHLGITMRKTRAVTHADLAPSTGSTDLGSKTAAFLMVSTIVCGLFCFVLCLIAETARSQVTWVNSDSTENNEDSQCIYTGSGKIPLLCAAIAFAGLAVAMVVEHLFMLIAVTKATSPDLAVWDPNSAYSKTITWQAGVESGHLKNWSRPRSNCLIIREGLFSAAGIFSLLTVSFAAGLYLTALRAQRISQEHENTRREILEAAALYVSPPRSPRHQMSTSIARENPVVREDQIEQSSFTYPTAFAKQLHLV